MSIIHVMFSSRGHVSRAELQEKINRWRKITETGFFSNNTVRNEKDKEMGMLILRKNRLSWDRLFLRKSIKENDRSQKVLVSRNFNSFKMHH